MHFKMIKNELKKYSLKRYFLYWLLLIAGIFVLSLISEEVAENKFKLLMVFGVLMFLVYVYISVRYESLTKVIELQNESKMRDEPIFYEEKSKEIIQLISTEGEVITVVSSKELDLLKKESRILPYCK